MKRLFGFMFMLMLLISMGNSQIAPPIMISGVVLDYNVAGIYATIENTKTGFSTIVETNTNGEFHHEANPSNWNCNDQVQITIFGKTNIGYMDCNNHGGLLGYVDHDTGLVFARFDFSEIECEKLHPCKECESCKECEVCKECPVCNCGGEGTIIIPECPECPECESGIIMQILGIIFGIVAGAGISLCVYKDKNGKLKFTVRMHRHEGRQYLHPTYRVHRAPYMHEYNEIMPVYTLDDDGNWDYIPINER